MTIANIALEEERALRAELRRRFELLDWEPPVTLELAQAELDRLPPRDPGEALTDWLRRCYRPLSPRREPAPVVPLRPRPKGRLRPLAEALAWAAAGQDTGSVALPDSLEVGRDAFKVHFAAKDDGRILVRLQALGWTAAQFQNREIAVTGPEGLDQLFARLTLDRAGAGAFEVPDGNEVRRLLVNMRIGQIEDS